jgi:hypothetical protein
MITVNPHKTGLVLGALMGSWHLLWAALVAFSWAQAVINFIFWLHFIQPIYIIGPFRAGVAVLLIGVTSAIGYAFGYFFGVLWNWLHR